MIKYKIGDLLTAPQRCIAHQVNCQGKMGSGVAKAIRNEYPRVYKEYIEFYNYCIRTNKMMPPGYSQIVYTENKCIFNLFGQINYGYDGQKYTSYAHLAIAIDRCFSEMYDDEYFLNKIRTLFAANHIRDYSFNVKREVSATNSSIFFIAAEIIFDGERIYKEWMVKDISD